ncbi:MAG: phosphate/phosphite/phosphonate ABC transporter substrate-binding protein [Gammaproteobacteria bacterium]|nr:phosphate/phosphite/phosphonate ABC transporter substrate-binding protein [Gammaproteobacteria bacterium]
MALNIVKIKKSYLLNIVAATLFYLFSSLTFPILSMAHEDMTSTEQEGSEHAEIRVVMSAAFVSESGVAIYDEIARYLAEKLNHKVAFVSGFSYSTINSMLDSGMADIGFICGLPYVMEKDQPQPSIDLLLAPVMKDPKYKDKPIYYSYVIVHKDSKINNFSDLKGLRFVFNDEISNSGYNMPRAQLIEMGETKGFFGSVVRAGSHEESIRMVASGKSDASAVDSLVYDYDLIKNPKYASQTKIIKTLGPAGIPPVVVSVKTPVSLRNKIKDILLGMKDDPVGKAILEKVLVDRFTVVDDSNYDGIRQMKKQAQDSSYMVIR